MSDADTGDDEVISLWFRRSTLIAAGVVLLVAVVLWFWSRQGASQADVSEADTAAPEPTLDLKQPPAMPGFRFLEQAAERGLDFWFENGAFGARYLPETMVGGVALFDFDGDNDVDVLLTGGNRWPFDEVGAPLKQTIGLFANLGDGQFQRVDAELGLTTDAYVMGMAVGDPDADGDPDVFLTTLGPNLLFENLDGQGFRAVTEAAGAAGGNQWSTGASFFDANGDGWQDLVVVNYVRWSRQLDEQANYEMAGLGRAYGPPTNFEGTQPQLFINRGDGTFMDSTDDSGLGSVPPSSAKSLAVLPRDFDFDGDTDLFVANDTTRNFLFVNNGGGKFSEDGQSAGLAFDNTGRSTGAMGTDATWLADEGRMALAVGNFANETTSFYVSGQNPSAAESADQTTVGSPPDSPAGLLAFADDAMISGIGPASRAALTFGLFFADLDGDGRQDLLQANGHVENLINRVQPSQRYQQPVQLFWQCGTGCPRSFVPVPQAGTADLTNALAARGAASGDIDNDGDLDLLLAEVGGAPHLLINETPQARNYFKLKLKGAHPNLEALGARVEVVSGDRLQRREISRTRSYLSQFPLTQTFVLGSEPTRIRVRWPDGVMSVHEDVRSGQTLVIEHPGR